MKSSLFRKVVLRVVLLLLYLVVFFDMVVTNDRFLVLTVFALAYLVFDLFKVLTAREGEPVVIYSEKE